LCSNGGLRRCRHDQKATCDSVPAPLEGYAIRLDDLFRARAQREGFRRCLLEGLLLPAERNKTLTALANTEPLAGAQRREAQSLQWFLSESGWDPEEINERRLEPFNLRDCDPRGHQVASQPGALAAGAFDPGAPDSSEVFSPGKESLVAFGGRRHGQFAQAPAQVVEGHRHVEVEVRIHTQDHLDIRTLRASYAGHHHVRCSFRFCAHYSWPDDPENGRYCDEPRLRQAPMRSRSGPGRLRGGA
jgi:hypothetical protein